MSQVILQQNFQGIRPDAVSFETGPFDLSQFSYSHLECPYYFPTALAQLVDAIMLGAPLPSLMVMNHTSHLPNILGPCLYLNPTLVWRHSVPELVAVVDRIDRLGGMGWVGVSHRVETLLATVAAMLSGEDQSATLKNGIELFTDYIVSGLVPNTPLPIRTDPIILCGNTQFIVAEIKSLIDVDALYAMGAMAGLCFMSERIVLFKRPLAEIALESVAARIGSAEKLDNFLIISSRVDRAVVLRLCHDLIGDH
jgi:hypothetical protein